MAQLSSAIRAPRPAAARKPDAPRATIARKGKGSIDLQHVVGTGLSDSRLEVTRPTDATEIDADRQAERVLASSGDACCSSCAAGQPCDADLPKGTLARKAIPGARVQDPFVRNLGAGRPLDAYSRAFFEPRFSHDFGAVRVHTGPDAQRATTAVGAHAFTVGPDIALGEHVGPPDSAAGQRLLAHELAHVVQQAPRPAIHRVGAADPPFGYFPAEREMLKREAAEKAAAEARHREWEKSHKEDHGQFLKVGATTTLTQDIAATRDQIVEQRAALLAEAAKRSQAEPPSPTATPPFGQFGSTAALPPLKEKVVIPPELPRAWAKAHSQTVVVRALLGGMQLTEEDTAVGRVALQDFYRLLIPIAQTVDRNDAEQERMSQELAGAFSKQNRKPCPNCHTPNPSSMPVFRAPPPATPPLQAALEQLLRVNATIWLDVMSRFERATKTMDALVLTTVPADHPAAQGFTFARDLLQRQEELQKNYPNAVRVPAVFYPEDKWVKSPGAEGKQVEIASGIPWYFYLTHTEAAEQTYPEGFSWTLRDITSPKRPEVNYEPGDVERYLRQGVLYHAQAPDALFAKLNSKLVFPKGMLYWRHPDGREGALETTEPRSLSEWLGFVGIGLVGLALILGTAGLATPAVLAGLGIAAAGFSIASTLADLHEKSELGILTQEDKNKAILFIAADIASALTAGLGQAAKGLGAAAAAAGRVSKLAIVVQRTAMGINAVDKALGAAVLVTMTVDFVDQYETIQRSNLPPDEREKALKDLTASALFTGAIVLAPHAVGAVVPKAETGVPKRDPLGLGAEPVKPVATITRGQLEPHGGWSKPRPEAEFTNWSTKQETLTPTDAAHELQVAQSSGTQRETPNNPEFKQEIQIESHTWKEERAAGGGWCRFTKKQCYGRAKLQVGVRDKGERVTAGTTHDVARLRAELDKPPPLRTIQDRVDWVDYRFYVERRLRLIEEALSANRTPPEAPRTFTSFKEEHAPGSVVRNEIQSTRLEGRAREASSGKGSPLTAHEAAQLYLVKLKERYPKLRSLDIRPKSRPTSSRYVGPSVEHTPEVLGQPQYRTQWSGAPEFAFEERMRTSQGQYSYEIYESGKSAMEVDGISIDGWLENIKIEQKSHKVDDIVARLRVEADFAEAYGLNGVHYSIGPAKLGDAVEAELAHQRLRNVVRVE